MKILIDGTKVSDRSYYFLLDWNEVDGWKFMRSTFDKYKLSELTIDEYKKLFAEATTSELYTM